MTFEFTALVLTLKYIPKTLSNLLGNEDKIGEIKQWMLQFLNGKAKKPILIYGPPGIGKTSVAYALQKEYNLELIEVNASELRNKERIEKTLLATTLAGGLFGRKKIALIDDIDVLAGRADSGGSAAIVQFLKSARYPVVLTASDIWDKKLIPIRNECQIIEFKKLNKSAIKKQLTEIAKAEKIPADEERISLIAENAGGDMRAALNDLEANVISRREKEKDIFNLVRDIFKADTYQKVKESISGDIDYELLKLWIDENIPNEYEKPRDIAAAYRALSDADIFDGRIRKSRWQLLKYSIDLTTAGVSLAKESVYRKFTKYSFPQYLKNMSLTVQKRALLKGIGTKLGSQFHCSRKGALDYLDIMKNLYIKNPQELMEHYQLEPEQVAFIMGKSSKELGLKVEK